jgi:hypothetical protein
MIGSLSLAALLGILALLLPGIGPMEEMLASVGLFAGFSLIALVCATVLEKGRLVGPMWAGVGASAGALGLWLVLVWSVQFIPSETEETLARSGGTLTILAALAALAGPLRLPRLDGRPANIVRLGTIVVAGVLAAVGIVLVWWYEPIERMLGEEPIGRGMGVLSILAACGTVVTPILWKVQQVRRSVRAETVTGELKVTLECPRCALRQELPAGRARCAGCGLRIGIEIEEPRCGCGYALYRLESDRCPECGRTVPQQDRWAARGAAGGRPGATPGVS